MPNATAVIHPTSVTVEPRDGAFVVTAHWLNVPGTTRNTSHGFVVRTRNLANRALRAIVAGAVFHNTSIRTDMNGKTYVTSSSRVMAKYMNADLKKLGF